MADEVEMTPVDAAEPPKGAPLGKPVAPVVPPKSGATVSDARPGVNLPTQPGLKPGLKLPPKPGATVSALRPGLKLPTQTALKPGVKLPPKPVIRKPGAAPVATALPKPVLPGAAPAPSAAAPVAPAPVAKPVAVDAQGIGKLPTVAAQAISRDDKTPVELPKPMETLKSVTQKLKGITQEIPQQAILHKTGIISDGAMSEGQKEAAKHKTARISRSDAMGVAPVKNDAAPMKTIRIKRPIDIPSPTASLTPPPRPQGETAAPAASAPAAAAEAPAAEPAPSVTQRKTLKISRPAGGVRPGGKFALKRPASQATTVAKPAPAAAGDAAPAAAAGDDAVADIPDIPTLPTVPVPVAARQEEGPTWPWTLSALVQAAACIAMGVLLWFFYENSQLPTFCGGLGWGS